MGALTSKPYAFSARSWELQRFEGVDFLDGFGSSIYLDLIGSKVSRITPRINEFLNEEWISDKIRFFYDGITRQRIGSPLYNKERLSSSSVNFAKVSWSYALDLVSFKFIRNYTNTEFLIGSFIDIASLNTLKNFTLKFLGSAFSSFNFSSFDDKLNNIDFRSSYVFNDVLNLFDKSDKVVLLGCNPRLESPIFNLKLIKLSKNLNFSIYSLGLIPYLGFNIKVTNLGLSIFDGLSKFISGKFIFGRDLLKSKQCAFILGSQLIKYDSSLVIDKFMDTLKAQFFKNSCVLKLYDTPLFPSVSELGFPKFYKGNMVNLKSKSLLAVLEENLSYNVDKFDFITNININGESRLTKSNLILPAAHPFEYNSTYINNFGFIDTNKVYSLKPFLESIPVYSIFNLLLLQIQGKNYSLANLFGSYLLFFNQSYFISLWSLSSIEFYIKKLSILKYFNIYTMKSNDINEFNAIDSLNSYLGLTRLYSSFTSLVTIKNFKILKNIFLPMGSYEYYSTDSFTRVSKNLVLAKNRFKSSTIYNI